MAEGPRTGAIRSRRELTPDVPVVKGIGAICWALTDEWQETEEELRRDLREAGLSEAEIDAFIARRDRYEVQVSVKQYADLSDRRRVFDPVYLGVDIGVPLGLDAAQLAQPLKIELERAFREEMLEPDDWDTLTIALRRLGIEINYEELLSLPLTVRLATPEDGPVPLPEL